MNKLKNRLVYYGSPVLRGRTEEITGIDGNLIRLIDDMHRIMHIERGMGLAAPQINLPIKLFVVDLSIYDGPAMTLINPEILEYQGEQEPYDEGCLSLPGINGIVMRPSKVVIRAVTPDEKEMTVETGGLLARVFQHEYDHLNGKLFIDHLPDHERKELSRELKKIKKLNRAG